MVYQVLQKSLDTIKNVASKEIIYCNLVIDEMNIRKHIKMDAQRNVYGYVNLGVQCNNVDLEAERVFRSYYNVKNYRQSVLFLTTQVKMNLYQYKISFQLSGCDDNHSIVDTHKDQLTKLVIQKYLDIRMFYEIRKRNDQTKIRYFSKINNWQ